MNNDTTLANSQAVDNRSIAHRKAALGLDRDFMESFNAPGYCPFMAAAAHAPAPVYAPGYPLQRDAKGRLLKLATRVNAETHWCEPSGLTVQTRAIKRARKS